ncbi:PAS domain-containing protein [Natrarchaeobius chitinivorans]|uniref:histidine kinase n=1 Tax=Natrarchaeobius chitinivorans TaxID=1679083 RepID=A0A3N6LVH0_NATCH|nr:PAS domain-containing protein [Natrarchaeobius chitinivorans]RQG94448.1 PAS domain S-box protein [Natrarchaeobius chitinivorans]
MDSEPETDGKLHTRLRQQEVVADFGQRALEADDIDSLLADACETVVETLAADCGSLLEVCLERECARIRQGRGWETSHVGEEPIPLTPGSQLAYVLDGDETVIVEDLAAEERFSVAPRLTEQGVVSGVAVPVGSVDDPWGVFEVYTTAQRPFTEHDATFVRSIATLLAGAIENHRSRREIGEIHERVSDGFHSLNTDWEFTYVNDRAAEFLGVDAEELVGKNLWEVFPRVRGTPFETNYRKAMETGNSVSVEAYYEPHDTWYEEHVHPSETGISIYFRDISERKAYEQQLTKYETIVETVNDGIYVVDEDGRFTMVNEAYTELTGYSREELLGSHVSLVVSDETVLEAKSLEERVKADETDKLLLEAELETASGERVPSEATFALLSDPADGTETERIGVARDISTRKERERALERSERRYRTLAASIPDGAVGVYDDDLRYTLAEGTVFGNVLPEPDHFEGETIYDLFPPDLVTELEPMFRAALEDGTTDSVVTEFADRTWRVWATPLIDPGGEIFAGLTFSQDITEQIERQAELERTNEMLARSNERLEQFAYAASHDLQEPMRMVSSYLQLLDRRHRDALDEDGQEFLDFALDGAQRMYEMIEGLLAYSRVDVTAGTMEPVDLNDVLESVLDDLQEQLEETDAEVIVESLPRVTGDPGQLPQVFEHLLRNALEYSGDEPPRIRMSSEHRDSEWRVSVTDDGIGIDPTEQDQIFEVFERLHSHGEHPGAGIGLALCQRIVERHGGEIWVDSEPGEGATFSFTLPARPDQENYRSR